MQTHRRTLIPHPALYREVFYYRVGLGGTLTHHALHPPLTVRISATVSSVPSWICPPRLPFPCAWGSILFPLQDPLSLPSLNSFCLALGWAISRSGPGQIIRRYIHFRVTQNCAVSSHRASSNCAQQVKSHLGKSRERPQKRPYLFQEH